MKHLHNYLDDYNRPEERNYTLSLSIGISPYDPRTPSFSMRLMAPARPLDVQRRKRNKQH